MSLLFYDEKVAARYTFVQNFSREVEKNKQRYRQAKANQELLETSR